MPQVNLLSVDISQGIDKKEVNVFYSGKSSEVSSFSSLVEKHMAKHERGPKEHGNDRADKQINSGNDPSGQDKERYSDTHKNKVAADKAERAETKKAESTAPPLNTEHDTLENRPTNQPASDESDSQSLLNFLAAADEVLVDGSVMANKANSTEQAVLVTDNELQFHGRAKQSASFTGNGLDDPQLNESDKLKEKKIDLTSATAKFPLKDSAPVVSDGSLSSLTNEETNQAEKSATAKVSDSLLKESQAQVDKQLLASAKVESGDAADKATSIQKLNAQMKEAQGATNKQLTDEISRRVQENLINSGADEASSEQVETRSLGLQQPLSEQAKADKQSAESSALAATKNNGATSKNILNTSLDSSVAATSKNEQDALDNRDVSTGDKKVSDNHKASSSPAASLNNPVMKEAVNVKSGSLEKEHLSKTLNVESNKENYEQEKLTQENQHIERKIAEEQVKLNAAVNSGAINVTDKSMVAETLLSASNAAHSLAQQMNAQDIDDSSHAHQIEQLVTKSIKDNQHIQKNLLATDTIAIYKKEFASEMKDKVMVMINQKLQQVDIQLDPPELGNVHVRVNLQNEQASVSFIVQNQQAKEALEQHMGKLRDMLGESGVDVGDSNVAQQNQSSDEGTQEGQSGQDNQNGSGDDVEVNTLNAEMVKASAVGVDFYA